MTSGEGCCMNETFQIAVLMFVLFQKKKIKDTLSVDGEVKKKKKKKLIVPPGEKPFKKPKLMKDKEKNKE